MANKLIQFKDGNDNAFPTNIVQNTSLHHKSMFPSAQSTGENHNMWIDTYPAGMYLLFANFTYPNINIETNWKIIVENATWIHNPTIRIASGSDTNQTIQMIAVAKLESNSRVGVYGDGHSEPDINYWSLIGVRIG